MPLPVLPDVPGLELIPVVPGPPGVIELPMVPLVNVPPLWPLVLPLVMPGVTPVEGGGLPADGAVVVLPALPPDCASANVPDSASAEANANVASFMIAFLLVSLPVNEK